MGLTDNTNGRSLFLLSFLDDRSLFARNGAMHRHFGEHADEWDGDTMEKRTKLRAVVEWRTHGQRE